MPRQPPPLRPLKEPSSGTFNVSVMFYRSVVLDYGLDENLNICSERPVVPSAFTDVSKGLQDVENVTVRTVDQFGPEIRIFAAVFSPVSTLFNPHCGSQSGMDTQPSPPSL